MTASIYVAIYFAIEDAVDPKGSCAVWAVETTECFRRVGEAVLRAHPEKRADALAEEIGTETDIQRWLGWQECMRPPQDYWRLSELKAVVRFTPERFSERQTVQQAGFLLPRDVNAPFMDNLTPSDFAGSTVPGVLKFEISNSERPRMLEQLRMMNITRASLFPGLDGFAQSLRQALVTEGPLMKGIRRSGRFDVRDGIDQDETDS